MENHGHCELVKIVLKSEYFKVDCHELCSSSLYLILKKQEESLLSNRTLYGSHVGYVLGQRDSSFASIILADGMVSKQYQAIYLNFIINHLLGGTHPYQECHLLHSSSAWQFCCGGECHLHGRSWSLAC